MLCSFQLEIRSNIKVIAKKHLTNFYEIHSYVNVYQITKIDAQIHTTDKLGGG